MSKPTTNYEKLVGIVLGCADLLNPPERLTVSQAASKYRQLHNPGSYSGPWKNSMVPYMVEPMDELTSPDYEGLIFVGPAQSAKTDSLIVNWICYSVLCDPMDLIVYSPSQAASRDFSMRRVDRLHEHTPAVKAMLKQTRDADNVFDKHYSNGMILNLSWPSPTEVAGKPIPHAAITDYDRIEEDIGGEGSMFDLVTKRNTTFGSFGMTVAESSPSRDLEDPLWIPKTTHEAPPTTGILALYNRGNRRRWYWPCPHCHGYFEGSFSMLKWDNLKDIVTSSESVRMECPLCGEDIHPNERTEMNLWGVWLKDGEAIDRSGRRYGYGIRSRIASFWMKGVAATFVSWKKLVATYLAAEQEYEMTGSEEALKKFYNTDCAEVYVPKSLSTARLPEHLKARAEVLFDGDGKECEERLVPVGVRFLVACVDVQKNMFVVQVHGILPGHPFDMVLVDRFDIRKSKRIDDDGDAHWVKPGTYLEDWDLIREQVMEREYHLAGDDHSRTMGVKLTVCDSGGQAGVTTNAYNFYRKLLSENKHGRFHLVKGDHVANSPRTRITYPDAQKKDKLSAARGDVPVLLINSNAIKDTLSNRLDCLEPGKGMYRFPSWTPDWWYAEICAEIRTSKGWENPAHTRNEAWDLSCYCVAACISKLLLLEKIDWLNPPGWCAEWDRNDMIVQSGGPKMFAQRETETYDLAKLASKLA